MAVYPSSDIERAASRQLLQNPACANQPLLQNQTCAARLIDVQENSPAYDAGFTSGCIITAIDGHPLRDIIDWRWYSSENIISINYIDTDGDAGEIELERDEGQDWGFVFDGLIFDEVRQCRNACTFCFMHQLPKGMRPSLSLRDDDFRLSFLTGTFVTFTNLEDADETRIIKQHLSPLRMSLHAIDPSIRKNLMGKHAPHGIEVLERLLAKKIEFHTQIVLVPGQNDGEVLKETLTWAYERPGIVNVGIVPLGFTKHQNRFTKSFNEPASAKEVLDTIAPFQKRAKAERGTLWVYAADEFYHNAYGVDMLLSLPPASAYGDFSLFEDGIGIIRAYVDDWTDACDTGLTQACACALNNANACAYLVVGEAMQPFLGQLLEKSAVCDVVIPLVVKNEFFGGNVDVTGLLCACDIVRAVRGLHAKGLFSPCAHAFICIPNVIFNDNGITLDDVSLTDMEKQAGVPLHMVSCNPSGFLAEITALAQ